MNLMWNLPNISTGYGWLIAAYLYAGFVCYLCAYTSNFYTELRKVTKFPRIALVRGAVFMVATWPIFGPFLLSVYAGNFIRRNGWRLPRALARIGGSVREVYRQARPWKGKYEYFHYAVAPNDEWYPAVVPVVEDKYCTFDDAVREAKREIGYVSPVIYVCRMRLRLRKVNGKRRWVRIPLDVTEVRTEPTVVS